MDGWWGWLVRLRVGGPGQNSLVITKMECVYGRCQN